MNKLARNLLMLVIIGSVLMVYGCAKDDDKGGVTRPSAENWRDLVVTLENMDSHLGQLIAFRVVSRYDPDVPKVWDELRCVARIDSLDGTPFTFTMKKAVPEGLHRLDFWTDDVANGWIDPSSSGNILDHSYRILLPATGTASVTFTHPEAAGDTLGAYVNNAWFVDTNQPTWIRPPIDLWMDFSGMTPAIGHALELKVVEPNSGRSVGHYRVSQITSDEFQIALPSIGDLNADGTGQQFQIAFYVDVDDNGTYNTGDNGWSITATVSTHNDTIGVGTILTRPDSLVADFTYNTNTTTIVWP